LLGFTTTGSALGLRHVCTIPWVSSRPSSDTKPGRYCTLSSSRWLGRYLPLPTPVRGLDVLDASEASTEQLWHTHFHTAYRNTAPKMGSTECLLCRTFAGKMCRSGKRHAVSHPAQAWKRKRQPLLPLQPIPPLLGREVARSLASRQPNHRLGGRS